MKSLFRRGKYYRKAINGECAKCKRDEYGCCSSHIGINLRDLQVNFSSQKEVNALAQTKVVQCDLSVGGYCDSIRFFLRMRKMEKRRVCVMWTEKGCRLAFDSKPAICRMHVCYELKKNGFGEFNLRDKKHNPQRKIKYKEFSKEEIKVIFNAFIDIDVGYYLSEKEYNSLDWNNILMTLQGNK
jgi:hypothetical protein